MCDYSLEMYQSRPARHGVASDSELKLSRIPPNVQTMANVGDSEVVKFTQVDGPMHRDSVRFRNGKVVTLQKLGPGVMAWLLPKSHVIPIPVQEKREAEFV